MGCGPWVSVRLAAKMIIAASHCITLTQTLVQIRWGQPINGLGEGVHQDGEGKSQW